MSKKADPTASLVDSNLPVIQDANGRPGQIGIVVPDLIRGIEDWGAAGFSAGGWRMWTYSRATLSELVYHGGSGHWSMTIALCGEKPQVELIEPGDGPSIYNEWLEQRGQGVHHIGWYVRDLRASIVRMEQSGFPVVQAGFGNGADGSGGFAYFDTLDRFGYYLEAIEVPAVRRLPDAVWPDHAV